MHVYSLSGALASVTAVAMMKIMFSEHTESAFVKVVRAIDMKLKQN